MAKIHFLNVDEGDCSIIQHDNGKVTMIDICCGTLLSNNPLVLPLVQSQSILSRETST